MAVGMINGTSALGRLQTFHAGAELRSVQSNKRGGERRFSRGAQRASAQRVSPRALGGSAMGEGAPCQ